jgi:3-oxoacyl-[acyl-carrier protein] reductase
LVGKIGIVTGAKSGIGAAVCTLLGTLGARTVAADVDFDEPLRTLPENGQIAPARLDVRDSAGVKALFEKASPIEYLVNCAGIGVFKPVSDIADEEWHSVIDTNLTGSFLCIREAITAMLPRGGRIVNIGSISGRTALPGNGVYGVSKCGLRMLSAMVNEDMWARSIRSTYLTLGAVDTPIWKDRPGFSPSDTLPPSAIANVIISILQTPLDVRLDEITVCPPKGVL